MSTVFIVDIDETVADNSHRKHLLKSECVSCGYLVSPSLHVIGCPNCSCDILTIPTSSWKSFTDPLLLANDTPILSAKKVILKAQAHNTHVHYITGRGPNAREVTQRWLEEHLMFDRASQKLLMREVDSYTISKSLHVPASVHKERAFEKLKNDCGYTSYSDTFFFFDDDDHVLPMYAKHGMVFKAPNCWEHMDVKAPQGAEPLFNK